MRKLLLIPFLLLFLFLSTPSYASTLDQSCTPDNPSLDFELLATGNTELAQQFTAGVSNYILDMDVKLKRSGTISSGDVWFTLNADSSNTPSTVLSTSGTVSASSVSSSYTTQSFAFLSPYSVTSSTKYWLVLHGSYSPSSSNKIGWSICNGTNPYASGVASYNSGGWNNQSTYDFNFSEYYGSLPTPTPTPTAGATPTPMASGSGSLSFDAPTTQAIVDTQKVFYAGFALLLTGIGFLTTIFVFRR